MAEDAESLSDTSRIDPVLDPELQTFTTLSRPEDPLQKVEMDLLVATLAKAQVYTTLYLERSKSCCLCIYVLDSSLHDSGDEAESGTD